MDSGDFFFLWTWPTRHMLNVEPDKREAWIAAIKETYSARPPFAWTGDRRVREDIESRARATMLTRPMRPAMRNWKSNTLNWPSLRSSFEGHEEAL